MSRLALTPACVPAHRHPANKDAGATSVNWPRGVTVSTLDSESSDRGSNPREASALLPPLACGARRRRWLCRCRGWRPALHASDGAPVCPSGLEALGVGYFIRLERLTPCPPRNPPLSPTGLLSLAMLCGRRPQLHKRSAKPSAWNWPEARAGDALVMGSSLPHDLVARPLRLLRGPWSACLEQSLQQVS